jgi:CelD/BcsL family acetyltransferase involved in cellulose biosynthesis
LPCVDEHVSGATVLELTDPRWVDFVAGQPGATPFHHPAWGRLIARCYGFRAFALATCDATGAIRAGLPLVEVRHLDRRPKWVSLPFTDYCPPLAPDREQEARLACVLRRASRAAGARRVEVRAPLAGASVTARPALRHTLALSADPARVYAGFRRSQARNVRRAEREGLTVRRGVSRQDLVQTFYRLHLQTRRRQGIPVQPRRFFHLLWEDAIAAGLGSVLIVETSDRPVAAAVFLAWNGTVIYKFGASDASALPLRPNHLIFKHAIQMACAQGARWFDFGRTDPGQEGLRNFKRSWGAVEEPLVYGALGGGPERAPALDELAAQMLRPVIRHGPPLLCRAAGEMLYRFTA